MHNHCTPPQRELGVVDKDKTITVIHSLQVDLSLLATWLARTPQPELPYGSLEGLTMLRNYLDVYTPCLTRH